MSTLRYAIRFLGRQKTFTVINMLGLALSLECCIVLTLAAQLERACRLNPADVIKSE